jgi:hypothetical protein
MGAASPAKRAPRKKATAAAKPAPGPRVVLDLDTLDKAKAFPNAQLPRKPFDFNLHGVRYELADPRDSDWKMALTLSSNPFLLMRTCLVDADEPIEDPTDDEVRACRERHGLSGSVPPPGSDEAKQEAQDWPDGVTPALIDRFTAAYLPGWKLNALFEKWHEHYNIDLSKGGGILSALVGKPE